MMRGNNSRASILPKRTSPKEKASSTSPPSTETLRFISWAKDQAKLWNCRIAHSSSDSADKSKPTGVQVKLKHALSTETEEVKQPTASLNCLCWHNGGQIIASTSSNGAVALTRYDNSHVELLEAAAPSGQNVDVYLCLSFNSTSRYLCGGTSSGAVCIWDMNTKKLIKQWVDHKEAVTAIQFSPEDSHIVSGSASGTIIIHSLSTRQAVGTISCSSSKQAVKAIQFSPHNKSLFVTASDDGCVLVWNMHKRALHCGSTAGQPPALAEANLTHQSPVTDVSFHPKHKYLLASSGLDQKIVIQDFNTGKKVKTIEANVPVTSICFLGAEGGVLAAGTTNGKMLFFSIRKAGSNPIAEVADAHSSTLSVDGIKPQPPKSVGLSTGKETSSKTRTSTENHSSTTTKEVLIPESPAVHLAAKKHSVLALLNSQNATVPETPSRLSSTNLSERGIFSPLKKEKGGKAKASKAVEKEIISTKEETPIIENSNSNSNNNETESVATGLNDVDSIIKQSLSSFSMLATDSLFGYGNMPASSPSPSPSPLSSSYATTPDTQPSTSLAAKPSSAIRSKFSQLHEDSSSLSSPYTSLGGSTTSIDEEGVGQGEALFASGFPSFVELNHSLLPSAGSPISLYSSDTTTTSSPFSSSTSSSSFYGDIDTTATITRPTSSVTPTYNKAAQSHEQLLAGISPILKSSVPQTATSFNTRASTLKNTTTPTATINNNKGVSWREEETDKENLNNLTLLNSSLPFKTSKPSPMTVQKERRNEVAYNERQHTQQPQQQQRARGGEVLEFQTEFIKNMIEDSLHGFQVSIHRDIQNLHLEMIRQFHIQQKEMEKTIAKYAETQEYLLDEIKALKAENEKLKNLY